MKRTAVLLSALALLLAMPNVGQAHWDAGTVWFIVQFPDEATPTIDGRFGDPSIILSNPSSF